MTALDRSSLGWHRSRRRMTRTEFLNWRCLTIAYRMPSIRFLLLTMIAPVNANCSRPCIHYYSTSRKYNSLCLVGSHSYNAFHGDVYCIEHYVAAHNRTVRNAATYTCICRHVPFNGCNSRASLQNCIAVTVYGYSQPISHAYRHCVKNPTHSSIYML